MDRFPFSKSNLARSSSVVEANANSRYPTRSLQDKRATSLHRSTPIKVNSRQATASPQQYSSSISALRRIDPKIALDAQSNGLVSRIVKYNENNQKLNRSLSIGCVYSRPGHFPVVHLKKSEVQHSVKPGSRPIVSATKIAPPDNSIFQANSRASILRTGSIVPTVMLPKSDEYDSKKYEPIAPSASENYYISTRSVLDELKEISRKRIIHDDVSQNDNKKYCKEPSVHQEATTSSNYNSVNFLQQIDSYTRPTTSKRQREALPSCSSTSPQDRLVKKRMYSKNNDITSSLSSSIPLSQPKATGATLQQNLDRKEGSLTPDSPTSPYSKKQRSEVVDHVSECSVANVKSTCSTDSEKSEMVQKKPKLTLFNKEYEDVNYQAKTPDINEANDDEGLEEIAFIKPRESTVIESDKKTALKNLKKSKLSLMLNSLSGDLDEEPSKKEIVSQSVSTNDTTDSSAKGETQVSVIPASPKNLAVPAQATPVQVTPAVVSEKEQEKPPVLVSLDDKPVVAAAAAPITFGIQNAASLPATSVGVKLTESNPVTKPLEVVSNTNTTAAPIVTTSTFSIVTPTTAASTGILQPEDKIPAPATSQFAFPTPTSSATTSLGFQAPKFPFNLPATGNTLSATTESESKFQFGVSNIPKSDEPAKTTTAAPTFGIPISTPPSNFNIGSTKFTSLSNFSKPIAVSSGGQFQASIIANPSLLNTQSGGVANTQPKEVPLLQSSSLPAITTFPASPFFPTGVNNTQSKEPATTIAPPKFNFGTPTTSSGPVIVTQAVSQPTFSFGAPTSQPNTTTAAASSFTFGGNQLAVKPTFGQPAANDTKEGGFMGTNPLQKNSPFTFGNQNKFTAPSTFSSVESKAPVETNQANGFQNNKFVSSPFMFNSANSNKTEATNVNKVMEEKKTIEANIFSTPPKAFSFGMPQSQKLPDKFSFDTTSKPSALAPPTFSSLSNNNTASNSIFPNNNANQAEKFTFDAQKTTTANVFSNNIFGSNPGINTTNTQLQSSIFGGSGIVTTSATSTTFSSNTFTFGANPEKSSSSSNAFVFGAPSSVAAEKPAEMNRPSAFSTPVPTFGDSASLPAGGFNFMASQPQSSAFPAGTDPSFNIGSPSATKTSIHGRPFRIAARKLK